MKEWHINLILIMLSVTTAGIIYLVVAQFNQKEVVKAATTEAIGEYYQDYNIVVTP